jgi:hypothetical protein
VTTTLDILRHARDLYAYAPSHAPFRDAPEPGTHCIVTALITASNADVLSPAYRAARDPLYRVIGESLPDWNAEHSTEEVLAAFDRAIAVEEAKQAEHNVTPTPEPVKEKVAA